MKRSFFAPLQRAASCLLWATAFGCGPAAAFAKEPPPWLAAELKLPVAAQPAGVPALVLRHEFQIAFAGPQEWTETTRYVVQLLAENSQGHASFSVPYVSGADEVIRQSAWLRKADGTTKEFGKADWLDHTLLDDMGLYSDYRMKLIAAGAAAQKGDVFACEVVVRRRDKNAECPWVPATVLPVREARLSIQLPKTWEAQPYWIGRPGALVPPDPSRPNLVQWSWRDLPHQPKEPLAPDQPPDRVFVKFFPLGKSGAKSASTPASWAQAAGWLAPLQDSACDSTPALTALSARLTAGLATSRDRAEAICRFVQQLPYAAVDKNLGLGFGCQPRLASQVLASRYGDCKDKVNLLRALLRTINVRVYPVAISARFPSGVDPACPTILQFNHMIAAIEWPAAGTYPAEIHSAVHGQLLFFDPTAETIPLGVLPWVLQGEPGLICDSRSTDLIRLPRLDPQIRWRQEGRIELNLDAQNGLEGSTTLRLHGELASDFRQSAKTFKESDLREAWSAHLSRKTRGMKLTSFTHHYDPAGDVVAVTAAFQAHGFGQRAQRNLWILRLDLLTQLNVPELTGRDRQQPCAVTPLANQQTIVLNWPETSLIESVPTAAEINGEFGRYRATYQVEGRVLTFTRTLELMGGLVEPGQYAAFRNFLLEVNRYDQRVVVLKQP